MSLTCAVIMDPIDKISLHKDTTFAMLLAIQKRGWQCHYLEQQDIYLENGNVYGHAKQLSVEDNPEKWYEFTNEQLLALKDVDVIFMRKDPPFDMSYIYTTYLLELVESQGVLVVNKPQSLRDSNEKLFTAWFPQCTPPTLVTSNCQQLKDFWHNHQDIIVKPLDGMGGQAVFRITKNDPNINVILETLTQSNKNNIMAQRYIPEITNGDKRVILVNGKAMPYTLARMAAPGETRANLAAGGRGIPMEITEKEQWIADQVGPTLKAKGLIFVGLDIIGDFLTEINVTSPTCVREIERHFDIDICAQLLDCVELYFSQLGLRPENL